MHPPTKLYTHSWVGESPQIQIFKQNWNILISSSAIEFLLTLGVPPGGGCMGMWGGERVPHTCAHSYAHTQMHAHACMHMCIWHQREFPGIPQRGQPFAWNYHVYHTCMCVCMHVHVHVCVGQIQPPPLPCTHPYPLEPQGAQITKIQ